VLEVRRATSAGSSADARSASGRGGDLDHDVHANGGHVVGDTTQLAALLLVGFRLGHVTERLNRPVSQRLRTRAMIPLVGGLNPKGG
jgi:hypothetical protein